MTTTKPNVEAIRFMDVVGACVRLSDPLAFGLCYEAKRDAEVVPVLCDRLEEIGQQDTANDLRRLAAAPRRTWAEVWQAVTVTGGYGSWTMTLTLDGVTRSEHFSRLARPGAIERHGFLRRLGYGSND